jgi:capsular exopolysaccharide synthesis family protein
MSNIFDALLKSETERAGSNGKLMSTVNDVLTQAEQRAAQEWTPDSHEHGANGKLKSEEVAIISELAKDAGTSIHRAMLSPVPVEHVHTTATPATNEQWQVAVTKCRTLDPELNPDWKFVSYTNKGSAGAEAFRLLAVRVRHHRKERPLKKLLITSTVPQEGKSLTSVNLACALSAGGSQRVLLIEGDVHRPSLTQNLGLSEEPGLCEYVQGHSTIEQSIYRFTGPEIWVLPAGQPPDHQLDLIQSPKIPELLEKLGGLFDWILIDSPPVLPMADTSILARLADGILLVTRRGVSEKKVLERGLQALDKNKLLGAIVNSSRRPGHDYYYYYGATRPSRSQKKLA